MNFKLEEALEILERTPAVLEAMLRGISDRWAFGNEGDDTWSPYDILGHLIHGEKTDWILRMEIILSEESDKTFRPFDRFAQFEESRGKSLSELLDEFARLRSENVRRLTLRGITDRDLAKRGMHPALGEVTLSELLATWAVHDLNHIAQISRVMAKQYRADVGPWTEYLRILSD